MNGDYPAAVRMMRQAVLLRADAMYRQELGTGAGTRRRLSQSEIARSVSLAILDRRDSLLTQAAEKGELETAEQVAAHIQRIFSDPKREPAGVYRLFREYFEYHKALDVFKDKPKTFVHEPRTLVSTVTFLHGRETRGEPGNQLHVKLSQFDEAILDRTLIVYLSDSGESHHPNLQEWPVVLLGDLGGKLKSAGRYLQFPRYGGPQHKTITNSYCTLLHAAGQPRDKFGVPDHGLKDSDQTGPLPELLA